ncbi:LysR family transcriptional regulator [Pelagibius sp.]|uniref:LysR family transcriptional regulator n=1 Tax=Pelagibius sp. TaxID=1931238 RepID=UPI0026151187|nr:LysR family transcriptional regulator [Pelagibius sp.]
MDWDNLRIFLALAQQKSVRGAAGALGVSHSTVSRRIESFEDSLGVRLFERLPDGFVLTPFGEDMMQTARRLEEAVNGLERRVLGQDARLRGDLRVTMPDLLAAKLLMPDLVAFGKRYPDINLEVAISYTPFDLGRREADVAIRITRDPPEALVGRKIITYARATYASRAYLAEHDPVAEPDSVTWIGWDDRSRHPRWVRETPFPGAPVRGRLNNAMVQLAAAKAGMGLAMLPCFMGDTEPDLRRVPPGKPEPAWDIWILTHEDLRATARVRAFMDFMAEAFLGHRDLLEGRQPQR